MTKKQKAGPLQPSARLQAELDYTMRKGYPRVLDGDLAAEVDSILRYLRQPLYAAAPAMMKALIDAPEPPIAPSEADAYCRTMRRWYQETRRAALRAAGLEP